MKKVGFILLGLLIGYAAFGESLEKDERTVLNEIGDFEQVYSDFQIRFLPLIIPCISEMFLQPIGPLMAFEPSGFDSAFLDRLIGAMHPISGSPTYIIYVMEDAFNQDVIILNEDLHELARVPRAVSYDPFAWATEKYGDRLTPSLMVLYDPARMIAEYEIIPIDYLDYHLDALAEQAAIEAFFAPMSMMMSSQTVITNLMVGIGGSTNGVVDIEMAWPSNFTDKVELFAATDLVAHNWLLAETNITTSGQTNYIWTDTNTNFSQRYYVAGNADFDGDSDFLIDARELYLYRTSITNSDTDGDGLRDGDEIYADGSHGDLDGFITDPLVQDTGYLLPDYLYTAPTTNLSGFSAFDPPTTNMLPNANTPAISEWTRTGGPGDTIALAAMGSPTNYVAYAPGLLHTSGTTNWFSGGHGAVTLPDTLPADEMILLWPIGTNGAGPAIALNKTEVWWNQMQAATGETFSIFGRNLGTNCHVWIEEENEWLNSVSCNPYKADFLVPTNYANGSYTLWAHNGTGHQYGFADSLNLEVVAKILWDETFTNWFDVTDYGAVGNGTNDDWSAIEAAIDDADDTPWSTVYFPAGHYRIGSKLQFFHKDQIRAVGAGVDLVTIQPHDNYSNVTSTVWQKHVIHNGLENFELKGLTLKSYGEYGRTLIRVEGDSKNIVFDGIRLDQTSASVAYTNGMVSGDKLMNLVECTNVVFRNCEFLQKVNILAENESSQIFVENCSFVGGYDAATLLGISGSDQISIVNSIASNLNDTALETSTNAWCQGRWVHGRGGFRDLYFGGNTTSNMGPRTGYSDRNVGEQVMFEFAKTHFRSEVLSSTSNTVTLISGPTTNLIGMILVVENGEGQGQNKVVNDINGATLTIDTNWQVKPIAGSAILVGLYGRHVAIYNNSFDGRPRALGTTEVAVAGIMPFGGCVDLVADGNRFHEIRYPINPQSKDTKGNQGQINQPNFFNFFVNNTITNCYHGIAMFVDKTDGVSYYPPTITGQYVPEKYS